MVARRPDRGAPIACARSSRETCRRRRRARAAGRRDGRASSTWPPSIAPPAIPTRYYRDVNVGGTERLLEAAAPRGVGASCTPPRWACTATCEHPPADETSPLAPGDVYQGTKAEAEALALDFGRKRGLPVAVVRPGAIYGPGETRLLKLFRAIARGRYAVVGSGQRVLPSRLHRRPASTVSSSRSTGRRRRGRRSSSPARVTFAARAGRADRAATGGRVLPFRIPAAPLRLAGALCEAVCVPFGVEPPSTAGASTSGRRAARSRSRRRGGCSATRRRWTSTRGSRAPRPGIARRGGCERAAARGIVPLAGMRGRSLSPPSARVPTSCPPSGATPPRTTRMAWSLAEDRRPRYEARDLFRVRREYPSGPAGHLPEAREQAGYTFDRAGLPWQRFPPTRVSRSCLLREGVRPPWIAAPIRVAWAAAACWSPNALALALALALAYFASSVARRAPRRALVAASDAAPCPTVAPVYLVWPTPEMVTVDAGDGGPLRPGGAAADSGGRPPSGRDLHQALQPVRWPCRWGWRRSCSLLSGRGRAESRWAIGESLRRGLVLGHGRALFAANGARHRRAQLPGRRAEDLLRPLSVRGQPDGAKITFGNSGIWMTTNQLGPLVEGRDEAQVTRRAAPARRRGRSNDRSSGTRYFWLGRFGGCSRISFRRAVAVFVFLLRAARRRRWLAVAAIAVSWLAYLWMIPDNWYGGGGTLGNRYFLNLPALALFLVPPGGSWVVFGARRRCGFSRPDAGLAGPAFARPGATRRAAPFRALPPSSPCSTTSPPSPTLAQEADRTATPKATPTTGPRSPKAYYS